MNNGKFHLYQDPSLSANVRSAFTQCSSVLCKQATQNAMEVLRKMCVRIQQGLKNNGFLGFQEGLGREEGDRMDPSIVSLCGSGMESEEGQSWQGRV